MERLPADIAAQRVRAAIGYAGLEYAEIEARTGIGSATLARIVAKSARRGASIEEMWAIADVCGVPRTFMEFGFDAGSVDGELDTRRRLTAIEEQLRALRSRDATFDGVAVRIGAQLDRLDSGGEPPRQPEYGTVEEAVEHMRQATQFMTELLAQLGRDVGRRDTEFRRAKGRLRASRPDAA